MADSYIRRKFEDILAQRAHIMSGGQMDRDDTGLLVGDGMHRKVGRPSKANAAAYKRRHAVAPRKKVGRGAGSDCGMVGLGRWHAHLKKTKSMAKNRHMTHAQAVREAQSTYRHKK
jgi:hypothetical protein